MGLDVYSESLSDVEMSVLNKGLGISITPDSIPVARMVALVEAAIARLPVEEKSCIINCTSDTIKMFPHKRRPQSNLLGPNIRP